MEIPMREYKIRKVEQKGNKILVQYEFLDNGDRADRTFNLNNKDWAKELNGKPQWFWQLQKEIYDHCCQEHCAKDIPCFKHLEGEEVKTPPGHMVRHK